MDNPELYSKYNGPPRRDAKEVLDEYSDKMKWKEDGDRIIDVGCGDGSVMLNVLKKYLPDNYVKLVGLDISEEVVNFAINKYGGKDTRVTFVVHDIQKNLPVELKGSFDKVFSFYLFHFVPDNEVAFRNTYQLMADGGTCLLTFMANCGIFEVFTRMSQTEKWRDQLRDVKHRISPYQFSKQPVADLKKIMENAGFNNIEIKLEKKTYAFENMYFFKQIMKALNVFKLLGEDLDDFVTDLVETAIGSGLVQLVTGEDGDSAAVQYQYELFVASASK